MTTGRVENETAAELDGATAEIAALGPLSSGPAATGIWLFLSLAYCLACAWPALTRAFLDVTVVQDDARVHVFWMHRFNDAGLFPGDMIADYFHAIAPHGYTAVFWLANQIGISPFVFHKQLPVLLGMVSTLYCFLVAIRFVPTPLAGFVSSVVLNQAVWAQDSIVSATPRAFVYPLLLAFLYYMIRQSFAGVLLATALMALIYPSIALVSIGVCWIRLVFRDSRRPRDFALAASVTLTSGLILIDYGVRTSPFGPIITASEARTMYEFVEDGRTLFFVDDLWKYWITGRRSGLFPAMFFFPTTILLGLALPLIAIRRSSAGVTQWLRRQSILLLQLAAVSLALFMAAHLLLFRLHLPNRYSQHSLRVALALAAGAVVTLLVIRTLQLVRNRYASINSARLGSTLVTILVAGFIAILPGPPEDFVRTAYRTGRIDSIYAFLSTQPPDALIASLGGEANNIPILTARPVLVGREFSIPYHTGYYRQVRARAVELMDAHYTSSHERLVGFIDSYGVRFFLVDRQAFDLEYPLQNRWLSQFVSEAGEVVEWIRSGNQPALEQLVENCTVAEDDAYRLVDAACVRKRESPD